MLTAPIYLDYNATTPVDQRVVEKMLPYFNEKYGNASSKTHVYGWQAEEAVEMAREQVAQLIQAKSSEIYFTSGATEALNIAIRGICKHYSGGHIITVQTEHKAVLDVCESLEKEGFEVTYLPVNQTGQIDLSALEEAVRSDTILITVMHANNETGIIHPIEEISELAKKLQIPFLIDASQAVGKIPVKSSNADMMVFSGHKMYGPKGVGVLYVKNSIKLKPILFGGGQEKGVRPGTLNVPAIVGIGEACEICMKEQAAETVRLQKLRDYLESKLLEINGAFINGSTSPRLPQTVNVSFADIKGELLLRSMPNLALSQGSACSSGHTKPSHVLKAMGLSDELAFSSIRISFGRFTQMDEMQNTVFAIQKAIERLRK